MTTQVGADEASRLLGVSKPTLYAYVSRGMLTRTTASDGRTSLYERGEVERLADRGRSRGDARRPTIDVEIGSAITELDDTGVAYRGHDVVTLAQTASFERVAELLWSGTLVADDVNWPVDRVALAECRRVISAAGAITPVAGLALAATTLSGRRPAGVTGAAAGRTLLAIAPSLFGGPIRGSIAQRLARAWQRDPGHELVIAVDRALVVLADHELATSTLGVRLACSVRADPFAAIAAGLSVVSGALHGAAASAVVELLEASAELGAERAVTAGLAAGQRLPGFGHSVYRVGDPRLAPLLEAVRDLPDRRRRRDHVEQVLAVAGRRLGQLPNVDLGVGALLFVAGLPATTPLFAIARIAGWAAHYDEELAERPVRFRGVSARR